MAYIALYRNYRPTTFSEVAGQKYIIKTLKNGVINNKISHAYIFSGQRGIGKTTIARILAKAVNCLEPVNGEPCNHCKNCLSIINNETSDIIEIDAASNNGVDEMRDLLEKVNFLPSSLKKKVYIIDEVHMLSISAFNALLKTLEEPPAHVMFVLATTEPHKIPMTILSRCQRFDFKQLSNAEISKKLKEICEKEGILIDDDALYAIADASEGGMRDAISILDQVSAYAESAVTIEDVDNVTGKISNYKLTELLNAFIERNAVESLKIISELLEIGKEPSRIVSNLVTFCRDILLYKNSVVDEENKASTNLPNFKEIADKIDVSTLFYYIDVLMDTSNKIKYTNSSKLYLEVAVMKIISSSKDEINLKERLVEIEEKIKNVSNGGTLSVDSELKYAELELRVKKITDELKRLNLDAFKEATTGKLEMLEEVSLNQAALPSEINNKITDLENTINQLKTSEYNTQGMYKDLLTRISSSDQIEVTSKEVAEKEKENIDENLVTRIDILEEYINNLDLSNVSSQNESPELINRIETLENSVKNIMVQNSGDQDEIMGGLLERMAQLEEKVDSEKENTSTIVSSDSINNETIDELSNNLNDLRKEVLYLEERISTISKNKEVPTNAMVDVSEYKNEVSVLKDNYFTIINSLEKILGDRIYEEDDTYEAPKPVDTNVIKEAVLKDTLDAIAVVKDELEGRITTNDESIIELNQKIEDINNNSDLINIKEMITKLENNATELNAKIDNFESQNLLQKCEELTVLTKDIKEYNLNLKLKYDELEREVKNIGTKPVENKEEKVQIEQPIRKVVEQAEPKPEVKPEPVKPVVKEEPRIISERVDETKNVYDIKIVERILHESREKETRLEKGRLVSEWSKIPNYLDDNPALEATACLLRDGTLTANGKNELLIVYSDPSLCNHLMSTRVHKEACGILRMAFGKDYDFIALPENTWQEKRKEYYSQYAIGIPFPVLSPINNPSLKSIVTKEEPKKDGVFNRVSSFFGSSKIRKEE